MIGDVLLSTIICRNLRKAYPEAQIDYMVYESTTPVLEGNTDFDNLILFKKEHRESRLKFYKLIKSIKAKNYDIVIDAYSKIESYLPTLFSGAKRKIAYKKPFTDLFYTDTVLRSEKPLTKAGLAIEHRLALLKPLELNFELETKPRLFVKKTEKEFAEKLFKENGIDSSKPTLMLSIIGSVDSKTYPVAYMSELIDFIADNRNVNLLFNYIPSQKNIAEDIYALCKEESRKKIFFNVLGKNLREFIAIMDRCEMIIGNDGGAINMAKALDKPAFIIFSPWIDKKGWATFEDGINNVSVELKDFKPRLFKNQSAKSLKKNTPALYKEFTPNLITPALDEFLKHHLEKKP